MKKNVMLIVSILIFTVFLIANAPAPYYACDGKAEGDSCEKYTTGCVGDSTGECVLNEDCEDYPDTDVNECLVCQ